MNIRTKKRSTLMSAVALAALSSAPVTARSPGSVMDLIADDPDHQLFIEAASAAGIGDVLEREYGFTLFLPTDDVLEQAGVDIQLSEPLSPDEKQQLADLLSHHIVPDELIHDSAIEPVNVESVAGTSLSVSSVEGVARVNDATILKQDIVANNGVVHVIDSLLVPEH